MPKKNRNVFMEGKPNFILVLLAAGIIVYAYACGGFNSPSPGGQPEQIGQSGSGSPDNVSADKQTGAQDLRSSAAALIKERQQRRVTLSQRLAAAGRLAAARRIKAADPARPLALAPAAAAGPGGAPNYYTDSNWAFTPPIRKFMDTLPGLNAPNNLGQMIPVAVPDTKTFPGSDYYEIAVRDYSEKMHSQLPPTKLRGYVQLNNGTDGSGNNTIAPAPIHYLGPLIITKRDHPVRLKFLNQVANGTGGDLFIPVDTTVMGAGMGPLDMPGMPGMKESYTQNRATLHLHGGETPWISDGTPHQWTAPAGEMTQYPRGVSTQFVPDMWFDPRPTP